MYIVKLLSQAQKDLDQFPPKTHDQVKAICERLSNDPRPYGSIKLTQEGGHRIRIGDYRLLYRVDGLSKIIYLYRIKHRKDAYR